MQFVEVTVGTAALNDSLPDAKVGAVILNEAKKLFEAGIGPKEVLVKLRVRWGAIETLQAIATYMGQRNFIEAVVKGRVYAPNADPDTAG